MKQYQVEAFKYNGFFVESFGRLAKYTASFKQWTNDAGIALCECSDGKERLIPTCQLVDFKSSDYPEQEKTTVLFGTPSQSN